MYSWEAYFICSNQPNDTQQCVKCLSAPLEHLNLGWRLHDMDKLQFYLFFKYIPYPIFMMRMVPSHFHVLRLQRQAAFIPSRGDWVLIYFIEIWEFGAVQIIWDTTGLAGFRFPLVLDPVPCVGSENGRNSSGLIWLLWWWELIGLSGSGGYNFFSFVVNLSPEKLQLHKKLKNDLWLFRPLQKCEAMKLLQRKSVWAAIH